MSVLLKKLLIECDRLFSIIVRKRDANEEGIVKCCTCPTWSHWSKMTCGHYRKRRHMSTRFHFKNSHPQCIQCNGEDKEQRMEGYLFELYGEGIISELTILSNKEKHFTVNDLKKMKDELSKLL